MLPTRSPRNQRGAVQQLRRRPFLVVAAAATLLLLLDLILIRQLEDESHGARNLLDDQDDFEVYTATATLPPRLPSLARQSLGEVAAAGPCSRQQPSAAPPPRSPIAEPTATIVVGNAVRLTVLTERTVRIEYRTADRGFDDRASFAIVNRLLPRPPFRAHVGRCEMLRDTAAQARFGRARAHALLSTPVGRLLDGAAAAASSPPSSAAAAAATSLPLSLTLATRSDSSTTAAADSASSPPPLPLPPPPSPALAARASARLPLPPPPPPLP